jgi:hypothetical protein
MYDWVLGSKIPPTQLRFRSDRADEEPAGSLSEALASRRTGEPRSSLQLP